MTLFSPVDRDVAIEEERCHVLSVLIDSKHGGEGGIIGVRKDALKDIRISESVQEGSHFDGCLGELQFSKPGCMGVRCAKTTVRSQG